MIIIVRVFFRRRNRKYRYLILIYRTKLRAYIIRIDIENNDYYNNMYAVLVDFYIFRNTTKYTHKSEFANSFN